MPIEIVTVALKSADFFEHNPALDVSPSAQEVNRCVLVAIGGPSKADEPACCQ
ncbi:hypothetical protein EDB81DRAFT_802864 [Dactylonectria macrodidyma]|uniref:Uncharacterized protein n=1 Tax=Dactylonectria macrodidyma TaxID=307937 RepID=A0A9P9EAA0_9HYPO|nr:hypothetical protein EDB81DRAFT_802864 [Dactylonectria macrodidyma]